MVIGDIIINNARLFPDKIGIIDAQTGIRFSWSDFNARVNQLANAMLGLGVKKGDRVGLISENSSQCGEFQFAIAKIGAIGCPMNYRLNEETLEYIIKDAEPKVILVQDKYADVISLISSKLKCIEHLVCINGYQTFPHEYESLIDRYPSSEPDVEVKEDDLLMLSYSSGTTGLPKAVLTTHKNRITYCIESCLFAEKYTHEDIAMVSAPYCAGAAGQVQFIGPAFVGAGIVMHVLKGDTWAEVIEREKVTVHITTRSRMMLVWEFIKESGAKYDLGSLQKVTTGGQNTSTAELKEILNFCGVSYSAKMYGLSETFACGTRLLPHEIKAGLSPDATEKEKKRLDSVGKPLLSTKIKIVNDKGEEVPAGEPGEIIISGDCVSPGYWNNPKLTEEVFRNGWFYTKDIGIMDEGGYLFLQSRKDYMIKTGGFLVSPVEIKNALMSHPKVSEAAVIGIPHDRWGEAVKAVVCLRKGTTLTDEELKDHCRQKLSRFQVPKYFQFIEEMPKDVSGRVQLKKVKELFGSQN